MELAEKIQEAIKEAMKARNKDKLEALRAVKSAILLANTQSGNKKMTEQDELRMLQKLVKQRKDSANIYIQQGRKDLADKELFEASVIEEYLPESMSQEELEKTVQEIVNKTGAQSMKDMGKVMGIAMKELAGKADGKEISAVVKKILG